MSTNKSPNEHDSGFAALNDEADAQSNQEATPSGRGSETAPYITVAMQVAHYLDQAGVPPHKHRSHVAKALNTSYPAARRLLRGESAWTDADILATLESIGLTWDGLKVSTGHPIPETALAPTSANSSLQTTQAILTIDGLDLVCTTTYINKEPPLASDSLCLYNDEQGTPRIIRNCHQDRTKKTKLITKVEFNPIYARSGPRVAILDDDKSTVEVLMKLLSVAGFWTEGFSTPETLLSKCEEYTDSNDRFDAFLLDWSLGDSKSIDKYIPTIRERQPDSVIIIMSGHFDDSTIDTVAINLAQLYDLIILPKPSPAIAIISQLLSALGLKNNNV